MTKLTKPQLRMMNLLVERPYGQRELCGASGSYTSGHRTVHCLETKGMVKVAHHLHSDSVVRITRDGMALMMGDCA